MKTIFLSLSILLTFASTAFAKDLNFEVPYLTHEEFVSLYEADQREYVILLRQAAADLSYEDQLSFFQKFNFQAPVWAALLGTSAHSEEYTAAQIIAKINSAKAQADTLNNPVQPNILVRTRNAINTMGENFAFGSDSNYLVTRAANEARAVKFRIVAAFRARDEAVAMISHVQNGQGPLRAKLRETQGSFDQLFNKSITKYDNKTFRTAIREYNNSYESFFLQPVPVAGAIPRPRAGAGVLAGVLSAPRAPAATCVRCIYAGFVISNSQKCEAVNSGSEMTAQTGPLQFPPPLTADQMNCEGANPVLCNPLLFGLKNKGPLCVAKSASATRSCMAVAGTGPESISMTAKMISHNRAPFEQFVGKLKNICRNTGAQCYSSTRRNDIRLTCAAIKETTVNFRDKMRLYSQQRPASGGAVPAAAPVRRNQ